MAALFKIATQPTQPELPLDLSDDAEGFVKSTLTRWGEFTTSFNLNKGVTSVVVESYETDISIATNTFVTERNSERFRENSE